MRKHITCDAGNTEFKGTIQISDLYGTLLHLQPMLSLLHNYMAGINNVLFGNRSISQKEKTGLTVATASLQFGADPLARNGIILGSGSLADFNMFDFSPTHGSIAELSIVYMSYDTSSIIKTLTIDKTFTASGGEPARFGDIGLYSQYSQALLSHDLLSTAFILYPDRSLRITVKLTSSGEELHHNFFKALYSAHSGVPVNFTLIDGQTSPQLLDSNQTAYIESNYNEKDYGLVVGSSNNIQDVNSLKEPLVGDNISYGVTNISYNSTDGGYIRILRLYTNLDQDPISIKLVGLYAKLPEKGEAMYYRKPLSNPIVIPLSSSAIIGLNFQFPFGSGSGHLYVDGGDGGGGRVPVGDNNPNV